MIIFLYGKDTYRSKKKLAELKAKFLRDVDKLGNSLKVLQGENLDLDEFHNSIASNSLFTEKRMIVIENLFKNKSKILLNKIFSYFENRKEDENIIVFFDEDDLGKVKTTKLFKFLSQQKFVQEFKEMSTFEVGNWLREFAKELGVTISQPAINSLNGIFGNDLWALENETKKIIHFKKAKQKELIDSGGILNIVPADIEKLCRAQTDENIFALTDAISQRRKALAVELLEKEFAAGVEETYLLHMIVRQFKILMQVRQALDSGLSQQKIINDLKLHPFVIKKSIGQVRNFSLEFLRRLFSYLVNIDREIKTGQNDLRTAIDLVIAKI